MCLGEYNYSKLKGKIREIYETHEVFAKVIGISTVSLSKKLNNLVDWKQEEIEKTVNALGIAPEDICVYFFTKKVEKNSINT